MNGDHILFVCLFDLECSGLSSGSVLRYHFLEGLRGLYVMLVPNVGLLYQLHARQSPTPSVLSLQPPNILNLSLIIKMFKCTGR